MSGADTATERRAWLALAATDGIGAERMHKLVAHAGSAAAVLRRIEGLSISQVQDALRPVFLAALDHRAAAALVATVADSGAIGRRLEELGVWTITSRDPDYPKALLELDLPPPVLYGQGSRDVLTWWRRAAVVGTRRPTVGGRALAAAVARRLVTCDAVVFSGLAVGIDGAAHAATIEAGGHTVAVIGSGHARPGPRAHRGLADRILATGGAIIGELPPDDRPTKGTYPQRNRIISAMSQATIVIEAPRRSGALITAHHALEQGRPVLVAPGRPTDASVAGCLALLRETPAMPLVGLDEMVVDLGYDAAQVGSHIVASPGLLSLQAAMALLGPAERAVAERLVSGPQTPDALIATTGLPPAVASGALTLLLMRGWAAALGAAFIGSGPLGMR
jgi:DNA processing protein